MTADVAKTGQPWSAAGGGPERRGFYPGQVRLKRQPARPFAAGGALRASVVFDAEDRALVADLAGTVQCFTPGGKLLWRQRLEGGVSATPAVDPEAGRLFVGTQAGWVCALQTADGSDLWRRRIPTRSDPRIVSDLLYVPALQAVVCSSWGGQYHALDRAAGESRHAWDAGIAPQAGASADAKGSVYSLRAVRGQGVLFVRMSTDGKESVLYRVPESAWGANRMAVAAAPVLDERRQVAYFVANSGRESQVFAWSMRGDRLLWQRSLATGLVATPAVRGDGAVVVADLAGVVRALAPDGSLLFSYSADCDYLLAGPVSDATHRVFLGDPLGRLHVIDGEGAGKPVFEAERSFQARPSIDRSGQLYLPGADRQVYVF